MLCFFHAFSIAATLALAPKTPASSEAVPWTTAGTTGFTVKIIDYTRGNVTRDDGINGRQEQRFCPLARGVREILRTYAIVVQIGAASSSWLGLPSGLVEAI